MTLVFVTGVFSQDAPSALLNLDRESIEAGPGQAPVLELVLVIREDLHLYRHSISVDMTLPEGLTWRKPVLPPGIETMDPASGEKIQSYSKEVRIPVHFREWPEPPSPTGTPLPGKIEVEFQACTDSYCLFPESVSADFEIIVNTEGSRDAAAAGKKTGAAALDGSATEVEASAETSELTGGELEALNWIEKGFLAALAGFFLTGLSLNLTPCVFPVIPITISYFGGQSGKSKGSSFASAFSYALGIALMFTVLGLVSSLAGKTWGGLFQDPWFVGGLSMIMLVLAASMFGVFEIMVPAFIMNKLGQSKEGVVGALVMGLTVGVVITPCAAGILIGLIGLVASTGMVVKGTILFFAMGMGLGLPYIILGTFSGLLTKLPMSGMWMVWVRKVFGLILIGVAVYFLLPHASTLEDQFPYWVGVLAVFSGLLLGFLDKSPGYSKGFNTGRRIFSIVVIILGLYSFGSALQAPASAATAHESKTGLRWEPYDETGFEKFLSGSRPIFIDFTAGWCAKCKELEHKSFPDPRVVEAMEQFTLVRVDMTKSKDPAIVDIKKRFDIKGLPTLIFIDASGKERKDLRQTEFIKPETLAALLVEAAGD